MTRFVLVLAISMFIGTQTFAQQRDGFAGRPITENLFMQTGNTLHKGEFIIGLGPISYGITEHLQVGTNVLLYLFQYYNINAKYAFINKEDEALAAGVEFGSLSLDVGSNDNVSFTAVSPFISYSKSVGEKTRLHLSGNYSYFESDFDIDDATASASSSGTSVMAGLEYGVSNRTKFVGDLGYDITFEGVRAGLGVMWAWDAVHLNLGGQYFKPKGTDSFVLPYVGLWWRFDG